MSSEHPVAGALLDTARLREIGNVLGVSGIMVTNPHGELLHSTIKDAQLNIFMGFLSEIIPALEETLQLGSVQHILLKSPQSSNLGLVACEHQAVGFMTRPKASLHGIAQQMDRVLHP